MCERKIIDDKKFQRVISPGTRARANKFAEGIRHRGGNARVIFEHNKTSHIRRYHVYEEKGR